ncbi:MAG TPA: VCBS repeat-containing protein [Planctomycetota bacterium]|nr:VCBS repeat-containing protein [Planctomycetota bacterium]
MLDFRRLPVVLAVCAWLVSPADSQSILPGSHVPTGANTLAVAAADLDLDGNVDLVGANSTTPGTVTVLLAGAPAEYSAGAQYPVGDRPTALAVADFDQDLLPDLVVANLTTWDLSILKNTGGGAFGPATSLPVSWGSSFDLRPHSVTVGDLDGDGLLDVASINSEYHGSDNTFTAFLGDGAGGFSFALAIHLASIPAYLETDDVDGDGVRDLEIANYGAPDGSTVSVFLAAAPLSYPTEFVHPVAANASSIALADFNGDGATDIAVSHPVLQGAISLLFGTGSGAFASFVAMPAPSYADTIATGDLDHDGHADLVTSGMSGVVASFLGDGHGGFAAPAFAPAGHDCSQVILADLDGDGRLDAATANAASYPASGAIPGGSIAVLLGDGSGRFGATAAGGGYAGSGQYPTDVALADLDGDGACDLLVLGSGTNDVSVARGNGLGGFVPAGAFPVASPGSYPQAMALGDFDGDGIADAATANQSASQVGVVLGTAGGGFGPPSLHAVGQYPVAIVAADLNDDGRLDLVTADRNSHQLSVLSGDGAGGFGAASPIAIGGLPSDVAVGDVNQDGIADLMTVDAQGSVVDALVVVPGAGGGSFLPLAEIGLSAIPSALAIGDLNGDSIPDVAVADIGLVIGASHALALLGDGTGAFAVHSTNAVATFPRSIAIGDIDRDGKADLVTASYGADDVWVLRGDGTGSFASAKGYASGSGPYAVAIGDVDSDGRPDVVTPSQGTLWAPGRAVVLLNRAPSPRGVAPYGSGTPGCAGAHGLLANGAPTIGNAAFALTCTNAPASALGLAILASAQDVAGSDPLRLGVLLHVDLLASTFAIPLSFASDASGSAAAPAAIPPTPGLAGATVFAQAIWVWPATATCDPSSAGISSSRGLALTLQ